MQYAICNGKLIANKIKIVYQIIYNYLFYIVAYCILIIDYRLLHIAYCQLHIAYPPSHTHRISTIVPFL